MYIVAILMVMRKTIYFPPYTEAEVKGILSDGSILCDVYGDEFSDTNISFPSGSDILTLTEDERSELPLL